MVYTKVVNDDVIDIIDSVGKENMQEQLKDKTFLIPLISLASSTFNLLPVHFSIF